MLFLFFMTGDVCLRYPQHNNYAGICSALVPRHQDEVEILTRIDYIIYFTIVFVIWCIYVYQLIDIYNRYLYIIIIFLCLYICPVLIFDLFFFQEESIRMLVVKTFAAAWFTESYSDVLKRRRYGEYMWCIRVLYCMWFVHMIFAWYSINTTKFSADFEHRLLQMALVQHDCGDTLVLIMYYI